MSSGTFTFISDCFVQDPEQTSQDPEQKNCNKGQYVM